MNTWVIYVGGKSRANYEIGKDKQVWGLKNLKSQSQMPQVKTGDSIVFVYNLTRPSKIFPKAIPGFPRVKNSEYFKFEGIAEEIVKGKITEGFYDSSLPVWPDNTYQYRFNFIIESIERKIYFTHENVGDELIKKALLSFHSKGDVASLILESESNVSQKKITLDIHSQELSSLEGKITYRIAKEVVRDAKIAKIKKEQHLSQHGKFFCEICKFSFFDFYGSQYDYIECHHINPLHQTGETETQLSDLILLCANCHRVVHQSKECMTIEKLSWIVTKSSDSAK